MQEDDARRKEVKEEEAESRKLKLNHRKCQLWLWNRLPNLYTAWMGPLVRVMYSGLTQSVFRLDRLKSSSCDCPEKIPVESNANARCFKFLVLVAAHPKLQSFVQLYAWSILLLGPKPPLAHYTVFIVCLATTSFKN
jgi:hypothetical protein